MSMPVDDLPSDYETEDLTSPERTVDVDLEVEDERIRDELKRELLTLAAVTDRGEYASNEEGDIIVDLVTQLEALNPTADPALACEGEWDLCLTNAKSFLSSPFFMAIRTALGDSNRRIAENGFDLHSRATSVSRVGRVRQSISSDEMVSEVDLEVGLAPGVPVTVRGTVITRAKLSPVPPETWEVEVTTTRVGGSNVPFVDEWLDGVGVELNVGDVYSTLTGSVPVSIVKTYYVDGGMRISRDCDDNFFVFTRA